MRRVLVDHARRRRRMKRGGGRERVELTDDLSPAINSYLHESRVDEVLAIDEALNRLVAFNPQGARIVQLRFFVGLSNA